MTVLAHLSPRCLSVHKKQRQLEDGTPLHLDRAEAENYALAVGNAIMEEPLATWSFLPPSSLPLLEHELNKRGEGLKEPCKLDLDKPDMREVRDRVGAVVLQQYHGQIVRVLAGWSHAVSNRQACIKVAWEFMEADRAALYPAVSKLIATYIGQRAAKDYMPIDTCAFNSAMQH